MNVSVRISTDRDHASMRDFAIHMFKLNGRVMDVKVRGEFTANCLENSVAL